MLAFIVAPVISSVVYLATELHLPQPLVIVEADVIQEPQKRIEICPAAKLANRGMRVDGVQSGGYFVVKVDLQLLRCLLDRIPPIGEFVLVLKTRLVWRGTPGK